LREAGVSRSFVDVASGKDTDRPQLPEIVRYVRAGDELVVPSFDQLARSLPDLLALVEQITGKGCTIRFLSPPLTFTGGDDWWAGLRLVLLGAVASFERDILLRRQREGIG